MRRLVLVSLLAVAAASGCGDDDGNGETTERRVEADVYATVVSWFADREPTEGDDPRPVFLDGLHAEIPIEVQVDVLAFVDDELSVRFIDADDEAIDAEEEDAPVREGGLLLRLGPVVVREDHMEVDVERYEGEGDVSRYRVVVESSEDDWRVAGEPEELPVPEPAA